MRADAIPMVGKRYGRLVVLSEAGRRDYPSQRRRMVRTRCDCGRVSIMEAGSVRDGSRRQCLACSRFSASIRCTSSSVALPDGRTIAGIAKAHGLPLNTVYRRWTRGWPLERLADPLTPQRAAKPGWGGSTDLPERRGAVYGTRSTASVSEAA